MTRSTPTAQNAPPPDGDDFQFDGYPEETRVVTKYVDHLSDDELQELNRMLRWNCFTVDANGRRFGRRARPGKRDAPQPVPDRRLKILDEAFGLAGKHVLEVGCFEGIHTVGLCRHAARVTAIDSRVEHVVKTVVRCALFDTHPTVFKCDLDMPSDVARLPQVDIVHHVGVLYHLVDPVAHLFDIAERASEGLMIDTHVARPGEDRLTYTARGRTYAYRHYREGGKAEMFAGMGDHAKWLSIDTLLTLLREAGFGDTTLHEEREERNGLRVLVLARRDSTPRHERHAGRTRDTISDDYLRLQAELHDTTQYGVAALGFGQIVKDLFTKIGATSISDYGAGRCSLRQALAEAGLSDFEYHPYDPVFSEYGGPRPADLVCCIDVLEHIEEQYVDRVIEDLKSITVKYGLFSIANGPAKKILADGRNAHLIQQPSSWWLPKFLPHFDILQLETGEKGFWFVVRPARRHGA